MGQGTDWVKTAKTPTDRADMYEAMETGYPCVDPGENTLQCVGPLSWVNKGETLYAYGVRLAHKDFAIGEGDDNILLFTMARSTMREVDDQMWVDKVERKGNNFVVHMQFAEWMGGCGSSAICQAVFAVNIGKLSRGDYTAQWVIDPLQFEHQDQDGWPKDAQPAEITEWNKQVTLQVKFSVVGKTRGGPAVPAGVAQPGLPGTENDLQEAVKGSQAIALCQATGDPLVGPQGIPFSANGDQAVKDTGRVQYSQRFTILEELKGRLGGPELRAFTNIDYATQRPVKKGQEVLLLLGEDAPDAYPYFLQALPDTPENRKLVGVLATAPAARPGSRWGKKSREPGLTPVQEAVYEQLAQMHWCELLLDNPGGLGSGLAADGTPDVPGKLTRMGMDAVPFLVEALDDTTMTRTVQPPKNADGEEHRYQVNEVVAYVISHICGRTFVLDDEPDPNQRLLSIGLRQRPDLVPRFQKLILSWYKANPVRPEVDVKLADVDDVNFRVRLDAVEWLGTNKVAQAAPAIVKYIDRTLAAMDKTEDSLKEAEICECAAALGRIGDRDTLPAVRKVCRHMFQWASGWYMQPYDFFSAYHAMAQLGAKDEALKDLRSLYESKKDRMEERTRQDFQKQLELASKWEAVASSSPATAPATGPTPP
jgi:hypothetical protein